MSDFRTTPQEQHVLADLDSTYRFTMRNDSANGMRLCEIVHNYTGKAWAEGYGDSERVAFENAIEAASKAPRPVFGQSAQIDALAAENAKLRAQLAQMQQESSANDDEDEQEKQDKPVKTVKPTKPAAPKPPSESAPV